ncbi:hypothetical protein SISNIDRAFT_490909 [Sistotremastrum niveocremeum HHB9708]|uniref:Uncharacterized protein n=1 Tax=Sistotremastrum niveocremeum HHB9708 TaxID=1314777 RepID=A0A164NBP2_9AGAM|nr:hypothetical protein SISNIDRAFT_490909 [Sistotremastrum niveocremeum HHB9708]
MTRSHSSHIPIFVNGDVDRAIDSAVWEKCIRRIEEELLLPWQEKFQRRYQTPNWPRPDLIRPPPHPTLPRERARLVKSAGQSLTPLRIPQGSSHPPGLFAAPLLTQPLTPTPIRLAPPTSTNRRSRRFETPPTDQLAQSMSGLSVRRAPSPPSPSPIPSSSTSDPPINPPTYDEARFDPIRPPFSSLSTPSRRPWGNQAWPHREMAEVLAHLRLSADEPRDWVILGQIKAVIEDQHPSSWRASIVRITGLTSENVHSLVQLAKIELLAEVAAEVHYTCVPT